MHDTGLIITLTGGLAAALVLGYVTRLLSSSPAPFGITVVGTGCGAAASRTTVRNESTTTTPGLAASTSFTMPARTASRSISNTTRLRFTNRTAVFNLVGSKNLNCCWCRSILGPVR